MIPDEEEATSSAIGLKLIADILQVRAFIASKVFLINVFVFSIKTIVQVCFWCVQVYSNIHMDDGSTDWLIN